MTPGPRTLERLRFLLRVTARESRHLASTTERLFGSPFTPERAAALEDDLDEAERVDAFVSRFARLQDTLGDKLLPALLGALGEKTGALIDNLDRAERLGLLPSADRWFEIRKLRNQMIHEYVEDPQTLSNALETAHGFVPVLLDVSARLSTEARRRGWA